MLIAFVSDCAPKERQDAQNPCTKLRKSLGKLLSTPKKPPSPKDSLQQALINEIETALLPCAGLGG